MQNLFTIFYHHIFRISAIVCVCCVFSLQQSGAQTLAFPEAEGFGRFAQGARGVDAPEVYVVSNLNDSGPGSFRDAVSQSGRFVVFSVGGIIKLNSDVNVAANTTIAGQTAPGDGIVVFNKRVTFSGSSNTIARYFRVRLGATDNSGKDASGISNGENMIFDHMSFTWGMDEVFSINWDSKGPSLDGITIQNSIIGQGLHRSNHSAGGLIQTPDEGGSVSLIKNLYISNKTRNPKVKGINEFVNNIVYNYGNYGNTMGHTVSGDGYIMGGSAGVSEVNIINNYFVGGPLTPPDKSTPFSRGTPTFNVFGAGNFFDNNKDGTLNGTLIPFDETGYPGIVGAGFKTEPFAYPAATTTLTAAEAYEYVIANVGANYPRRDQVDGLLIDEVDSRGTEGMYVYRESDLPFSNGGVGDVFNAPAPLDSDQDGMPDAWEDANGLDKNNAADAVAVSATASEYLNIEVYVNTLVNTEAPAFMKPPSSIAFTASSTEEPPGSEVVITWVDNSDSETNFVIERSEDGETFEEIAEVAADVVTYTDVTDLVPNNTYTYRIKAKNATEESAYSTSAAVQTPPIPTAPALPSNPTPSNQADYVGTNNLNLSWTGSENAVSYKVYFGTDENALAMKEEVTTASSTVASLTESTQYFWRVDAVNDKGTTTGDTWSFTTQQSYEAGKIGHWSFNETSEDGNQITDSSSYENHGILGLDDDNVGIRVPGKFDNALDFSTASDDMYVVSIPDQGQLYLDKQSFSISFWMKADAALLPPDNNSSAYLLCKGSITKDESTGATGKRFDIEFKNKQLRFAIDDANDAGGGGKDELQADGIPFFSGDWEHVVVVRDDINKKLRLYLNGAMVKETNITKANGGIGEESALILGNIGELEFLTTTNTPSPYKGMLDELKMFNYSLSDNDINALLNGEDPGAPVVSLKPENPAPENQATGINPNEAVLGWTGGADSYDVYMGTSADALTLAAEGVTELTYTATGLEQETAYFWRVDATTGTETTTGDVWSFTTGILTEGALVGHWSLDASAGTEVIDETTFQNHGQLVDLTEAGWIEEGKNDNAYDFSGGTTTSHISVPNQEHLYFDQSSFSVSFWMKADPDYPAAQAYLINKGEFGVNAETGGTGQWFGVELKDGLMRFAVDDNVTKTELPIADNSPFFTGDWVHVVAVRDTESDKLILYRDGVMIGEKADGTNGPIGSTLPLIIGNSAIKNAPFTGMMDDVKIFNYTLSAEEVGALYTGVDVLAKAFNPEPTDASDGVDPNEVNFSWTGNADTYNLYIGTTAEDMVLEAEGISESSYTATDLSVDNTYFWRVDALRGEETTTGDVWSFTTGVLTEDALVGHWSLNASAGTEVRDETTFQNHGQLVDLTEAGWIEGGKYGNAYDFSGGTTTSHISVPNQDHLYFDESSFSVSFWMKADPEYPAAQAYLINKGEFGVNTETGGTGQWFGIELKDGLLRFAVDDNSTKTELPIADNSPFFTGDWVHVVAVRDTESDKLILYRDGEMIGEKGDGTNGAIGSPLPLIIGNSSIKTAPFLGMMDDVKMFNYSLSPEEVAALFAGVDVLAKASNPTPADASEGIDPTEVNFTWTGNADTYNVYIGTTAENMVLKAEGISETSYTASGLSKDNTYLWRVDAIRVEETVTGDVWSFSTPDGDLVGHWSLNATAGTTVTDETPYANHGQLVDLTEAGWTEGLEGNAYDFSGGTTSSRIQVPHQEQLLFEQNSFTLSFWMKADTEYPDAQAYLINKGEFGVNAETGGTGQWFGVEMKDGLLRFAVDDNSTKTELTISDNGPFLTNEWVHVVAVRDTENDKLLLYRDGVLIGEKGDGTNKSIATVLPLVIGNSSIHTAPFMGMMDEVKVFNYSLTGPEILSLNTGIPVEFIVTNPSPEDAEIDVNPGEVTFSWTGSAEKYNLYLGTDLENLQLEAEGLTEATYTMTSLSHETTYYWRIDPVVGTESRTGDIWSFTTREPVDKPSAPSPANDAVDVEPVDLMLSWTGNADYYNVYMGDSPDNLQLTGENLTEATFETSDLVYATTYYWRVDATTGAETATGDVWSFYTRESIGQTTAPTPAHESSNIDTDPNSLVLSWSGNSEYYDVYMGTDPDNMELKVFGISETLYTVFWELTPGTQYFWRVDARSGEEEKEGVVWSFTTHSVSGLDDSEGKAFNSFPNPFSDILNIGFTVTNPEKVNISLYDNKSQLVKTLFDGTVKGGYHDIRYDFNAGELQNISQGVYFIVIQTADQKMVKKLVYLK